MKKAILISISLFLIINDHLSQTNFGNLFNNKVKNSISQTSNLYNTEELNDKYLQGVSNIGIDEVDSLILNSKQIKVSATLFELNIQEMKERGINWQSIISKPGLELNSNYKSIPKNNNDVFDYSLNLRLEGDIGSFSGYSDLLLKFLEDENLGKIESKLSVIVRNEKPGRMQVGSDFSIKQLDFAGNIIDAFFPTGTIIEVLPKIITYDTLKCALLKVNIERSFAIPGQISTEVKKTNASSEVILRNGEEVIVGGLLYNQYEKVRSGIPFFKDLPWWVLGLRYLTGYERLELSQREIFVLLKIEIIPSLVERLHGQ